jgi:hypothetical protein
VVALAKLQAGDRPEMQAMVQSLQLGGSGRTVALSFTLPTEFFEALGALAGARREAAQGLQDAAEGMRDAGEAEREAARKLREAADRLERQHPR